MVLCMCHSGSQNNLTRQCLHQQGGGASGRKAGCTSKKQHGSEEGTRAGDGGGVPEADEGVLEEEEWESPAKKPAPVSKTVSDRWQAKVCVGEHT